MDQIAEQGVSAYFVGNFNPSIITPHWLAMQDVLTVGEADRAEIEVVHKEISRFGVSGLKFDVTSDKFHILAEAEPFVRLVDVVACLFLRALPHTPISAAVLNYYVHAELSDFSQRMRFGREFAPIQPWGSLADLFEGSDEHEMGGMTSLTMQMSRGDDEEGVKRITLQPSRRVNGEKGIFVQVSDTFEKIAKSDDVLVKSAKKASKGKKKKIGDQPDVDNNLRQDGYYPKLFVENFDTFLAKSRSIAVNLVEKGMAA